MIEFDKTKSCQNCPDRAFKCHVTCEGYKQQQKKFAERRKLKSERNNFENFLYEVLHRRFNKK